MSSGETNPESINVANDRSAFNALFKLEVAGGEMVSFSLPEFDAPDEWHKYQRSYSLIDPNSNTADLVMQLAAERDRTQEALNEIKKVSKVAPQKPEVIDEHERAQDLALKKYELFAQLYHNHMVITDEQGQRLLDNQTAIDAACADKKEMIRDNQLDPVMKIELLKTVDLIGSSFKFDLYVARGRIGITSDKPEAKDKVEEGEWHTSGLAAYYPEIEPESLVADEVTRINRTYMDSAKEMRRIKKTRRLAKDPSLYAVEFEEEKSKHQLATLMINKFAKIYEVINGDLQQSRDDKFDEEGFSYYLETLQVQLTEALGYNHREELDERQRQKLAEFIGRICPMLASEYGKHFKSLLGATSA